MSKIILPEKVSVPWNLSDYREGKIGSPKNGLKVFSCFHCGGGSTMGYKLAGFDVMGGVEIDPEMMEIYRKNHNPRHSFLMGVGDFNLIENEKLPKELFEIDILDGSPPCSSFSMAGSREKEWGNKKKFREGQSEQILDDLFFDFIRTAEKLKPKIVVAENVKGLVMGKARGYVKQIFAAFDKIGYDVQLFILNAAMMGVPQRRERTFFIARRRNLILPKIKLQFQEKEITAQNAFIANIRTSGSRTYKEDIQQEWSRTRFGHSFSDAHIKKHHFNWIKLHPHRAACTIASSSSHMIFKWDEFRSLNEGELIRLQSFPDDYDFMKQWAGYVTGMSVPPLMMQRIALEIAHLILSSSPVLIKRK